MQAKEGGQNFLHGALILAASALIVKLIGALYKIPLGNILDDEGFGHFNNAYVIYNLLLMVSTAGLPVALSKTISEANALGKRNQVHRVFQVALITFFLLGTVTFLVMFTLAQPLANLQGDGMAVYAVQAIAPACFFVCVLSTFRGYAQGHSNMVPTAVSQVIEALGKLVIGLALAWYLVQKGADSAVSAAGAIFGVTCGAGLCLIYLIIDHILRRQREHGRSEDQPEPHGDILRRLLVIAVPITLCASVTPITSWLDTAQVQNILRDILNAQPAEWYSQMELTDPVVAAYGAYQKAITIYNLPSAFMVSLTACIVPAVSAALTRKDKLGAGKIAESALRVGALLALPAGVGLAVLSGPIIQMLYPETNQEVASHCLLVLGIASAFVCMMLLCNAILQANGRAALPIWFIAIGSATKLAVNFVLVQIPSVGIKGAPMGTLVCFALVSVMELVAIKKVTPHPPKYLRVFVKPAIAAGVMGAAVWASYGLLAAHLGNTLSVAGSIVIGCVVYGILVLVLRIVSRDDLSLMPKGDKIAKLLRIR